MPRTGQVDLCFQDFCDDLNRAGLHCEIDPEVETDRHLESWPSMRLQRCYCGGITRRPWIAQPALGRS